MLKTRGMRHLALRVGDIERTAQFYKRVFGMTEVWSPDPDNIYLSSGCDNLALHRASSVQSGDSNQPLDHLGFIVAGLDELESDYEEATKLGLKIVHPLRKHRDGSASFYIRDPEGNVIQVLYEPKISPLSFKK